MSKSIWDFIIPHIEVCLKNGITNKAKIAREIIKTYNLDNNEESIRLIVSKFIRKGKVQMPQKLEAEEVIDLLKQKGFNSELKSIWKGPTKNSPGYSIRTVETPLEELVKKEILDLKNSILEYSPVVPLKPKEKSLTPCCAILNMFDAHIDKLTLQDTTGKTSTIEKNIENFTQAFDNLLLSTLTHNPEEFIFPVGSDFFNSNVFTNTTKRGTPQENGVDAASAYRIGIKVYRTCIDKLALYGKVRVVVIKGNHDEDTDFYLGVALELIYENNENVIIDNSRLQRKYIKYGRNLFGFAHGDKEKSKIDQLPLIMAEEAKQEWAETDYREFYLGDIHHKQEYKFLRGKDFIGCMVRFLRSVSTASDTWHMDQGYIGIPKTAEAFVWDENKGMKANYLINI